MKRPEVDLLDPQLASLVAHGAVPPGIGEAVREPAGAQFYKCALQVNPHAYTVRHAKQDYYKTEEDYNAAIAAACVGEGIDVVGITDHFRIATSQSLAAALSAAGIHVLLGFEANSSEGVHLLCLFPGSTSPHELERAIGACGVTDLAAKSPQSDKSCEQLLQSIPKMGGITIAAHARSAGGLLVRLKGQTRGRVWTSPDLQMGHPISADTVRAELVKLGFSRQSNRKADEGSKHPDRNAQFEYINSKVIAAQAQQQPVI
jgi:PHP family Zn ribbon phosphoesterase